MNRIKNMKSMVLLIFTFIYLFVDHIDGKRTWFLYNEEIGCSYMGNRKLILIYLLDVLGAWLSHINLFRRFV